MERSLALLEAITRGKNGILFHGTGARRLQSIKKRGLLPKLNSYVYAASNPVTAAIFAAARAEQEDDYGLIVMFKEGEGWEVDPQFPDSLRRRNPVPPSDIVSTQILNPEKEIEAFCKLIEIAESIGIKVQR